MVIVRKTKVGTRLALLLLIGTLTGCFGSMNATARLKTWNREIENRWAGEATFLLLRVPYQGVYGVVAISDLLLFNSIEFWTGQHPIDPVSPERRVALKELDARRHGGGSKASGEAD